MTLNPEFLMAMFLQTVVIIIAVVASIRHSEKRLSTMETKISHLEVEVAPIPGISRAVARLEGRNKAIDAGK